jgi:hypothetical protein
MVKSDGIYHIGLGQQENWGISKGAMAESDGIYHHDNGRI